MRAALLRRLEPVLSPRSRELFATLLDHVVAYDERGGDVRCELPEHVGTWTILAPLARSTSNPLMRRGHAELLARIERAAPPAHRRFLEVCGGLVWGEVGDIGQLVLGTGFTGTLHARGAGLLDADAAGFAYTPDLFAPIDVYSHDFYVRHPLRGTLLYGAIGKLYEVEGSDDAVEVYLRELHRKLVRVGVESPFRRAFEHAPHRNTWLRELPRPARGA